MGCKEDAVDSICDPPNKAAVHLLKHVSSTPRYAFYHSFLDAVAAPAPTPGQ